MERFDFRAVRQPTWEVELPDGKTLHVRQPTQGRAARIQALNDDLKVLKDKEQVHRIYDFVAELLNENEEGVTLTGKELHAKYHIADWQLMAFIRKYNAFIEEIKGAKN